MLVMFMRSNMQRRMTYAVRGILSPSLTAAKAPKLDRFSPRLVHSYTASSPAAAMVARLQEHEKSKIDAYRLCRFSDAWSRLWDLQHVQRDPVRYCSRPLSNMHLRAASAAVNYNIRAATNDIEDRQRK